MQGEGIDDAPDVVNNRIVDDIHMAGAGIDRQVNRACAVGVSGLPVVEAPIGLDAHARDFIEGHAAPILRPRHAIHDGEFGWIKLQPRRCCNFKSFQQLGRRINHRAAAHDRRA